jgi:hypothetical protein
MRRLVAPTHAGQMMQHDLCRREIRREGHPFGVANFQEWLDTGLACQCNDRMSKEENGVNAAIQNGGCELDVTAEQIRRERLDVYADFLERARGVFGRHDSQPPEEFLMGPREQTELVLHRIVRDKTQGNDQ